MKTKSLPSIAIPEVNILGAYDGNVSRAYEIAAVGGHSITLCYYREGIDERSSDERSVNPNDCKLIADTFGFTPVVDGEILLEVVRTQWDYLMSARKGESLETIHERIAVAKQFPRPTALGSEACLSLFRTAYERLNLCATDVQTVFKVAATIAQMAFSEVIRVEHIAEAIQYRSVYFSETTKIYKPS